jgi:iron complex outermembrane receptor protein
VEVGSRALLADRVLVDAALFSARVTDELVAFDVPNQPGRRAFRNAGQTSRTGAEVSARAVWPHWESGVALTWSRFQFDRYQVGTASYAGNPIPGAPRSFGQAFTTARWGRAFVTTEVVASARVTADDAALVTAAAYTSWTVRAGLRAQPVGAFTVAPVLAVENLTDARYATSVVINATRGRYFEPGLPRRVALLLQVGWR